MTPTLTPAELAAVNMGRCERGLPPLGGFAKTVQASAAPLLHSIVAEGEIAPPVGGESRYELTIKNLGATPPPPTTMPQQPRPSDAPRWTVPTPPAPSSSTTVKPEGVSEFARQVTDAVATRLGRRLRKPFSKPTPEPESVEKAKTFAEQVAREVKRRIKPWRKPAGSNP